MCSIATSTGAELVPLLLCCWSGFQEIKMSASSENESEIHESSEEDNEDESENDEEESQNDQILSENSSKSIKDDLQLLSEITSYVNLTSKRIQVNLTNYSIMKSSMFDSNDQRVPKQLNKKLKSPARGPGVGQKDLLERAVNLVLEDYDSTSMSESSTFPNQSLHTKRNLTSRKPSSQTRRGAG
jgi:ribosomal protein S25